MKNITENVRRIGEEFKAQWIDDDGNVIETWTAARRINVQELQRRKAATRALTRSV